MSHLDRDTTLSARGTADQEGPPEPPPQPQNALPGPFLGDHGVFGGSSPGGLADLQRQLYRRLSNPRTADLVPGPEYGFDLRPMRLPHEWRFYDLANAVLEAERGRILGGHSVVGLLRDFTFGVRHYGVEALDAVDVELEIETRLTAEMALVALDEPACVMHDDCEVLEELGRECWRHHHPRR